MLLVVAWDGACFDVVEPFLAAGKLPNLAQLLERGASRRLQSTIPPVTFPAWTSFLTGATPDRHGVTDFTIRRGYEVSFANASYRRLPTIFEHLSRAGRRVGLYAVPATYPPNPLNGFVVSGFDTPFGASLGGGDTYPPELRAELVNRYGGLANEGLPQSKIGKHWHRAALVTMTEQIRRRTKIVHDLMHDTGLGRRPALDALMVHYGESDTVSHHFQHFCDAKSPRFKPSPYEDAIEQIYVELDKALGTLLETLGLDGTVMLVSDHGSQGASDRAIYWNLWLAERGWLAFTSEDTRSRLTVLARKAALRWVPERLQAPLFARFRGAGATLESRSRFSGIDWSKTRVFSEELNYFPALWLNRRGREPSGIVSEAEERDIIDRLREDLLGFRDRLDGRPVVKQVRERRDIYDGPFAEQVPDILLELENPGGYVYAARSSRERSHQVVLRRMMQDEMTGARGTSMSGAHSPQGLCILAGPRVRPGRLDDAALEDAGVTVMALAGLEPTERMNGRLWRDCVDFGELEPTLDESSASGPASFQNGSEPYNEEQERVVAERLRDLGYLE